MSPLRTPAAPRQDDDAVHIQRTLKVGPEHFAPLVEKYQRLIGNLILRMVRNRDAAEELTQEVFLLAYESLSRFDTGHAFAPWITRIAHNHTLNYINKRRVKALSLDEPLKEEEGASVQDLVEDWARNPERSALDKERMHWVAKGLDVLPERYRMLMLYRYWLDMPYQDIGAVTGLETSRIKYLLNYGRRLLHDILRKFKEDGR